MVNVDFNAREWSWYVMVVEGECSDASHRLNIHLNPWLHVAIHSFSARPIRLEAIATRLEAIATRLEAIASRNTEERKGRKVQSL